MCMTLLTVVTEVIRESDHLTVRLTENNPNEHPGTLNSVLSSLLALASKGLGKNISLAMRRCANATLTLPNSHDSPVLDNSKSDCSN